MRESQQAEHQSGIAVEEAASPEVQIAEANNRTERESCGDPLHTPCTADAVGFPEVAEREWLLAELVDQSDLCARVDVVPGDPVGDSLAEPVVVIGCVDVVERPGRDLSLAMPHLFIPHVTPLQQSQLPCREASAAFQPSAEEVILVAQEVADDSGAIREGVGDGLGQLGGDSLVGVEKQDPLLSGSGLIKRPVALVAEVLERVVKRTHIRASQNRLSERAIRAARVNDDHVLSPCHRADAIADVALFIVSQDDDREWNQVLDN